MNRPLLTAILTLLVFLAAECLALAGPNIYPDPSFETSGVAGVARTGERAGTLKVGARDHWASIGGGVPVEPFARYRITEWVKAKIGQGNFFAPYCYEWNNYEWAFAGGNTIRSMPDWTQVQYTFVSPNDNMFIHPLAYIEAENCEAWVDDIVVEKIAEPAQVIAEIEARATHSADDTEILARWYVKQGKMDAAQALLDRSTDLVQADLACLIAQHTPDVAARRPFVVAMLAAGGPIWHDGVKRFGEITAGMSDADKLSIATDAAKLNPTSDRTGRSVRLVLEAALGAQSAAGTVTEEAARIESTREAFKATLAAVPANSAAARELQAAMKSLDEATAKLEARKAALGHCIVKIGGKTITPETHAIVTGNTPTPQELYAARDLRTHLELITGQTLPLCAEKDLGDRTPLIVGKCGLIKTLGADIDFDGLGLEGIHVKTVGPAVILAGNKRGVIYATDTFLEDYLGCRWFTPDCSTWPTQGTIEVPEIDRRYIPPLEYRAGDYPVARPGPFAAHVKLNGANHQLSEEQGGKVNVRSLAHTFAGLVPPERYYKDHPEYFSLVGGKRQSGYAQLCLTNPEVLRIAIQGVRQWIKNDPEGRVFSVSQNDTGNWCQCENCTKVAEEEGSQAGPIIRFVNAIADNIKDDYPDVAIETLAYQYSRKPPKLVKPRPNVIVCLCSIECCFIHPLETDPFNQTFSNDIKGWNDICKRLWIWDYVINYAHSICPFPNLYVLKPNTEFFINNGVRGIYEESCYYTKGSESQELRNYIIAKTMWNPSYDTDKAIDEFCAAYYGPAGKYVREYLNVIHQGTQKDPKLHVQIYTHPRQYVTAEMIADSNKAFDQAEEAVKDNPIFLHRVQVARLPILYAQITLATSGSYAEKADKLVQQGATDVSALAGRFEQIARAEGVTMIREGGPDANLDAWLQAIPRQPHEVQIERIKNPALELSVLPEMGGRLWRLKLLPSGREMFKLSGKPGAWNPTDGGYEEFSEGDYRTPGWSEPYAVKERDERGLTLEANLRNGLRLTRRLELDAEKPLVRITSTLTNTTNETKAACLRSHPEFAVTSTQKAKAMFLRPGNRWESKSLANAADPGAEKDTWLRGEDVPAGAWAFVDEAADLALVDRVPQDQIGQCLLNWNGAQARVNLEVYAPQVKLAPGKSVVLQHVYEIVKPAELR